MAARKCVIGAMLLAGLIGCDGKDPERLRAVGTTLNKKGQATLEEAKLPKVTVTWPKEKKEEKTTEPEAPAN